MAIKSKKNPPGRPPTLTQAEPIDYSPLELGFVIDKSVSMLGLKTELVTAFNALLAEQMAPNASSTLVLFSDGPQTIFDGQPIRTIPKLDFSLYRPEGNTALLDAIGAIEQRIGRRWNEDHFRVLVAIFTDGFENSSTRFSVSQIADLIEYRQMCGWAFLFITPKPGAEFGRRIRIPESNIVDFEVSAEGLKRILGKVSQAVKAYRLGDRDYARLLTN
jgi:hypothetical protein